MQDGSNHLHTRGVKGRKEERLGKLYRNPVEIQPVGAFTKSPMAKTQSGQTHRYEELA